MSPDPFDLGDLDFSGLSRDDILSALIDAAIVGAPDEAEFSLLEDLRDGNPVALQPGTSLSAPTDDAPFYSPDQPRDERGRWTAGGSAEGMSREEHAARREAASAAVRDYLQATHQPTREETAALAGHLSTLTVKQLHGLRKEHGLKDPRLLKADFVNALHGYFKAHREKQAAAAPPRKPPGLSREQVLGALRQAQPRLDEGAMASIRDARRALGAAHDKASFDRHVLDMGAEGTLDLHAHDLPSSLSPGERADLVQGDRGREYTGAALHDFGTGSRPGPHQALAAAVAGKQDFTQPFQSGPYHAVRHNPTGLHVEAEAGDHSGRFAVINPQTREVHSRHDTAEAAVNAVPGASRIGTGNTTAERELRDRAAQAGQGRVPAGESPEDIKARINQRGEQIRQLRVEAETSGKGTPQERLDRLDRAQRLIDENKKDLARLDQPERRPTEPPPETKVGGKYALAVHTNDGKVHVRLFDNDIEAGRAAYRLQQTPGANVRSTGRVKLPRGMTFRELRKATEEQYRGRGVKPQHISFEFHRGAGFSEEGGTVGTDSPTGEAGMADQVPASVPFSADPGGEDDGRFVLKDAPVVFRAGSYDFPADKGGPFSMSPEEVRAAVEAVGPDGVPISNEHNQRCFFQGRLGRFIPKAWPDFGGFGGVVKLAKPVLDLVGDVPIKLSANFDRLTKTLKDVTLTHTPRITDAALFAAFTKDDPPDEKNVTPHGRAAMQALHDMAARSGALCKSPAGVPPGASDRSAAARPREAGMADAPFTSDHERDALQAVHDTAAGMGASCTVAKLHPKKGEALSTLMAQYTETPAPSAREQELERQLAAFKDQEAQFKERLAAVEKANQEAQFSAAVSRLEAEAVAFVTANAKRLYGKRDRDAVAAMYVNAGRASLGGGAEVQFSDEKGATAKGTLLDAFKASILARPETGLDVERVPGPLTVLFGGESKDPEDEETKRLQKSVEERAARDNARNGSRR